eukprot:snap_masked-scaffold_15-processed-gene-9.37-mRNA-1 protein AED:1.00 eAED:1.00 QI:0/0/0/0/1/1/4/0/245
MDSRIMFYDKYSSSSTRFTEKEKRCTCLSQSFKEYVEQAHSDSEASVYHYDDNGVELLTLDLLNICPTDIFFTINLSPIFGVLGSTTNIATDLLASIIIQDVFKDIEKIKDIHNQLLDMKQPKIAVVLYIGCNIQYKWGKEEKNSLFWDLFLSLKEGFEELLKTTDIRLVPLVFRHGMKLLREEMGYILNKSLLSKGHGKKLNLPGPLSYQSLKKLSQAYFQELCKTEIEERASDMKHYNLSLLK